MELKSYKEIIINGMIMKSLSIDGDEVWKGIPDPIEIIKDGQNSTETDWVSNNERTTFHWGEPGNVLDLQTRCGPRAKVKWTVTTGINYDLTEFKFLKMRISMTQNNKTGWEVSFKVDVGGKQYEIPVDINTETDLVFDISDVVGEVAISIIGSNYGDSADSNVTKHTKINDIWLTGE